MDKILNNLGLCKRAGGLITGSEIVIEGIRNKKVFYVFLASDASMNTKKKINDKCNYYKVLVCDKYSSEELSNAIGVNGRMVIGITNKDFIKILK